MNYSVRNKFLSDYYKREKQRQKEMEKEAAERQEKRKKADVYKVFKPLKSGKDQVLFNRKYVRGVWLKELYLERIYKSEGLCTVYTEEKDQNNEIEDCLLPTLSLCSGIRSVENILLYENDVLLYSATDFDYDILVDHLVVEFNEEKCEFQLRSLFNGALMEMEFASECNYIGNVYSFPDLQKDAAQWLRK